MMPEESLRAAWTLWAAVNQSSIAYQQCVRAFGGVDAALAAPVAHWQQAGVDARHCARWQKPEQVRRIRAGVDQLLERWARQEFAVLLAGQAGYPRLLSEIADPPPFLWVQGAVQALLQPQVAVVGTRRPTASGRQLARRCARELAEAGLWVVSGLAHGIDSEAHQGALAVGGGRTVAVLGSGVDQVYPANHRALADQLLAAGGALVSEFLPGTPARDYHFPRRNRVVSGLSLATLVIEAAQGSGSLITATLAAEQGRQVFALPGHVDNPQAAGCHQLIREGATLVTCMAELLEDLNLPRSPLQPVPEAADPRSVPALDGLSDPARLLLGVLDWQGQAVDVLVERLAMEVSTLMAALLELELAGLAMQQNGWYQRCRQ